MKMKMNMALVAGALALSMAGQANAAIVTGTTGASDLILQIWDSANNTSYTKDLGISITSFLSGVSGTNTALSANAASSVTGLGDQTFTSDALLTSYLASANQSALVWSVFAIDNSGPTGFQGKSILTTTNVNIKSAANSLAASNTTTSAAVYNAAANLDLILVPANGAAGAATSVTATAADQWIAKPNQLNTALGFNTTAAVGTSLNFWYVTPSATTNSKASVAQFQGNTQVATWTLASNGNLTYTVGAVPEPGEWLLMLSGLGLIGFIATRRKNAGSMTFA